MQVNCALKLNFSKASGKPPHPFERKSGLSILVKKKKKKKSVNQLSVSCYTFK